MRCALAPLARVAAASLTNSNIIPRPAESDRTACATLARELAGGQATFGDYTRSTLRDEIGGIVAWRDGRIASRSIRGLAVSVKTLARSANWKAGCAAASANDRRRPGPRCPSRARSQSSRNDIVAS